MPRRSNPCWDDWVLNTEPLHKQTWGLSALVLCAQGRSAVPAVGDQAGGPLAPAYNPELLDGVNVETEMTVPAALSRIRIILSVLL